MIKKYSQTDLPDPDPHFIICTNHNTDRSVLQQFQNPGKWGGFTGKWYISLFQNPDIMNALCNDSDHRIAPH